jgi:uncharacterized membrane protein YpjA
MMPQVLTSDLTYEANLGLWALAMVVRQQSQFNTIEVTVVLQVLEHVALAGILVRSDGFRVQGCKF